MLRRHRQIRTQIHQLMDACLFAVAFWLAYEIRATEFAEQMFKLPVQPFTDYVWFYMLLIPAAPLMLESQGFYDRSLLGPRHMTLWPLLKSCAYLTLGLVFVLFFVKFNAPRAPGQCGAVRGRRGRCRGCRNQKRIPLACSYGFSSHCTGGSSYQRSCQGRRSSSCVQASRGCWCRCQ